MIAMNPEQLFIKAAEERKRCTLFDSVKRARVIEPYMVYQTSKGKRCFHFFQIEGYSESQQSTGWKNPEVHTFVEVVIEEDTFSIRGEYNPFNMKMFPRVYFALPNTLGQDRL